MTSSSSLAHYNYLFTSHGLFLSFQPLTAYDQYEENDGSHLPMVQPARDLQRRVEKLDKQANEYRTSQDDVAILQEDLEYSGEQEAKLLVDNVKKYQKMLVDYLEGLHPIIRMQKEAVKDLTEYLTPPTVELFQRKAGHILQGATPQQISMTKKNTCTICMDASADCVIKRTCSDKPPSSANIRCERDICKCGPTMCRDCILTHYWTSTGKGSKSYARCVCCRAEFCLKDIFPVQYVEDEAYLQLKAEQEKRLKAEEEQTTKTRRARKSKLTANNHSNNTTTTTTTTTSTHSHSDPFVHPPFFTPSNSSSDATDNCDEEVGTRKRRRTSNNSHNSHTNTCSTTSHNNTNPHTDNNTHKHSNNVNENNNHKHNGNETNNDDGRPKYNMRSSRRFEKH